MRCFFYSILGSIGYVGKLFGSIACGFASEYFGRRNAMFLINFPHLIAFYLFYYSTSVWKVFAANILLGFGAGYMKAPCSTYVAEIRYAKNYSTKCAIVYTMECLTHECWFYSQWILILIFIDEKIVRYRFVVFYYQWPPLQLPLDQFFFFHLEI